MSVTLTLGEMSHQLVQIDSSSPDPMEILRNQRALKEFLDHGGCVYPTVESLAQSEVVAGAKVVQSGGKREIQKPLKFSDFVTFFFGISFVSYLATNNIFHTFALFPIGVLFSLLLFWRILRPLAFRVERVFSSAWKSFSSVILWRIFHLKKDEIESRENETSSVTALAWHPNLNMFAVSVNPDREENSKCLIRIFDGDAQVWLPIVLKHALMTRVRSITWCPGVSGRLAVGTSNGVLLWTFDRVSGHPIPSSSGRPLSFDSNNFSAWVEVLIAPGHVRIESVDWSPCGRFIAAGAANSDTTIVWTLPFRECFPLSFPSPLSLSCGGIRSVRWSPSSRQLLVSSMMNTFAIFETSTWTSRLITTVSRPISPIYTRNGRYLLMGFNNVDDSASVWCFRFKCVEGVTEPWMKFEILNLPPTEREGIKIPTKIQSLALSETGERLVVTLEGHPHSPVFVVEVVGHEKSLRCVHRGYVQSANEDSLTPILAAFRPTFFTSSATMGIGGHGGGTRGGLGGVRPPSAPVTAGALLALVWNDPCGKISMIPFYFQSVPGVQNSAKPLAADLH